LEEFLNQTKNLFTCGTGASMTE